MPLSDHERRVLAEIEQDLITDDPRLAKSIVPRRWRISTVGWAMGLCLGLACVVLGVITAGGIGAADAAVGFLFIVASCWAALRSRRRGRPNQPH